MHGQQTDEDAEDDDEDESQASEAARTPAASDSEVPSVPARRKRRGGSSGRKPPRTPVSAQTQPPQSPGAASRPSGRQSARRGLRSVPEGAELQSSPARPVGSPGNSGHSFRRDAFDSWAEGLDAPGGGDGGLGGLDFSLDALGLGADDDPVWRRTRAHLSLADVSLEELEARLQRGDEDRAAAEDAEYHRFLQARRCCSIHLARHMMISRPTADAMIPATQQCASPPVCKKVCLDNDCRYKARRVHK